MNGLKVSMVALVATFMVTGPAVSALAEPGVDTMAATTAVPPTVTTRVRRRACSGLIRLSLGGTADHGSQPRLPSHNHSDLSESMVLR